MEIEGFQLQLGFTFRRYCETSSIPPAQRHEASPTALKDCERNGQPGTIRLWGVHFPNLRIFMILLCMYHKGTHAIR